jgi:hypothetical protein
VLALAVVVWATARLVPAVQRFDDLSKLFASRHELNDSLRRVQLPHVRAIATVVAVCAAAVLVHALVTTAVSHATRVWSIVVPVTATLVAELLKNILPQVQSTHEPRFLAVNTFPSAHVAFVVACAGAVFWIDESVDASPRWRHVAMRLAVPLIMLVVVAGGMHRPSDAIGGALLAAAFVELARVVAHDDGDPRRGGWERVALVGVAFVVATLAAAAVAPAHLFSASGRVASADGTAVVGAILLVVVGAWIGAMLAGAVARQAAPSETRRG